jgi:hypothetical protein
MFGQDSNQAVESKNMFTAQAGIYYKMFLNKKYIEPVPNINGDDIIVHQYERFTKIPVFGYSIGMLFTHKISKRLGLTSGLIYFMRKDIYENNMDTVIKYGNRSNIRDIHNMLKYEYYYHNLEIPVMLQYSLRKLSFNIGVYISTLTYKIANYTYVINQNNSYSQWTTSKKSFSGIERNVAAIPAVQLSYSGYKINKVQLNPFIAFYYSANKENELYIQCGLNFPL